MITTWIVCKIKNCAIVFTQSAIFFKQFNKVYVECVFAKIKKNQVRNGLIQKGAKKFLKLVSICNQSIIRQSLFQKVLIFSEIYFLDSRTYVIFCHPYF